MRFDIDERLAKAETPAGPAYCDADVYREEVEKIFARHWLSVPAPPSEHGALRPFRLLSGALDAK